MIRLAILLCLLSMLAQAVFMVANPHWLILPALLLGWFLADMVSGIVHMVMDYHPCRTGVGLKQIYFYEGSRESAEYQQMFRAAMARINPVERLIYDFKNHHPRPNALGRRSLERLIGSSVVAGTLPLSLIVNIAIWFNILPVWVVAAMFSFLVGTTFAQYFHGSLHRDDNPWFVVMLRRIGLLMTPQAHQKHHDSLRRDFSTNSGWSNLVLNPVFALAYRKKWLRDEGLEPQG